MAEVFGWEAWLGINLGFWGFTLFVVLGFSGLGFGVLRVLVVLGFYVLVVWGFGVLGFWVLGCKALRF